MLEISLLRTLNGFLKPRSEFQAIDWLAMVDIDHFKLV
jgi:hypothetical protein